MTRDVMTRAATSRGGASMSRAALAALALLLVAQAAPPTLEPQFEAAFQGRCGTGNPCEQLCLELHDGTFECGCGQGFVLHVDGYGCLELNATKPEATPDTAEDVLYSKDVSFSAELVVAPSSKISRPTFSQAHTLPERQEVKEVKPHISNFIDEGERTKERDGLNSLLADGLSQTDLNIIADDRDEDFSEKEFLKVTTQGPSLEQKVPDATVAPPWTAAVESCNCAACDGARCSCPLTATKCHTGNGHITTPRFSGASWLALPALRGAYKRVRVRVRVRPERARGVLLLTGEHDDLSGDYLALVLRQGRVELRFDCGSGSGVLRSPEPVRLGRWNTVTVYRHRWDAWLKLNNGRRVRGRSKGLFSRMTFREPVWLGGGGNTTGLQPKLGLSEGLLGCVDFLRINGDTYRLVHDAIATSDIGECAPTLAPWRPDEVTTVENVHSNEEENHAIYDINDIVHFEDNDIVMRDAKSHKKDDRNELENSLDHYKNNLKTRDLRKNTKNGQNEKIHHDKNTINPEVTNGDESDKKGDEGKVVKTDIKGDGDCLCQHGGGCVIGVCLCPLGYAGARCEITLDLKVPRFNGSSYLRLPGLGNSAQSWLDIQVTFKPTSGDGLLLYNADHASGDGDFFSLHLRNYFVEFAFDLGSGIAVVRSPVPLTPHTWQHVSVARSGRRATLTLQGAGAQTTHARGAARRLSLRRALWLGGAPELPGRLGLTSAFNGCVRQLVINDEQLSVVSAALGGVNVDNCDHDVHDNCSNKSGCTKETLEPIPDYPQNISESDPHHNVVAKKGFKSKYHKNKAKKHITRPHIEQAKRKALKKYQNEERSNDVLTEGPAYDGRTYMQVKYLDSNEINWGDTNTYPSFMGTDSFIHIDDDETMRRLVSDSLDINIRFRCSLAHALLAWSGGGGGGGGEFLALAVEGGVLVFRYNLGSGEVVIVANRTRVSDGLWHRARATRSRQAGVLEVDGLGSVGKIAPGSLSQLNTRNGLYIGGMPNIEMNTMGKYKSGLVGCVSQISLSGDFDIPLSLSKLPHTITSNVGRCLP